jgi:transcriptional regulator with XRE-family HTH domain
MYRMNMILATESEIRAELGKRLADLRIGKGLSQLQLSQKAGVGVATLQRFEQGQGATLSTFIQLLMALGRVEDINHLLTPPALTIEHLEAQFRTRNRRRASSKPPKTSSTKTP